MTQISCGNLYFTHLIYHPVSSAGEPPPAPAPAPAAPMEYRPATQTIKLERAVLAKAEPAPVMPQVTHKVQAPVAAAPAQAATAQSGGVRRKVGLRLGNVGYLLK